MRVCGACNGLAPGSRRLILLILASLAVAGCASPVTHQMMVPTDLVTTKTHPETVSVAVNGGNKTDEMGKSQISNEEFALALQEAITRSKIFSRIEPGPSAQYLLTAQIISLDQPTFGFSFTVKLEVGWTLKRADTGKIVWRESIRSEFTAGAGDAFAGVTRLRIATEGAARANIASGLGKISQLEL